LILADFIITLKFEIPREVRVVVYDHVKGLRIAASRYDNRPRPRRRRLRGTYSDTLGICHRFETLDDEGQPQPLCAIVRLARPNLGVGIITHELAHAAVWVWELTEKGKPLTCDNDEPFAWMLGELVRQTINAMNERGVYDAA